MKDKDRPIGVDLSFDLFTSALPVPDVSLFPLTRTTKSAMETEFSPELLLSVLRDTYTS